MTMNEQTKILDNKIRSSKVQYDLDRQNAKISALSSGELDKYEYLTGEDLGYKPDIVQKARFEYSPLGQLFNKGLTTDEKQERLLKGLKYFEDKTDKQLEENKDSQLGVKSTGYIVKEELSQKAKNMLQKLNNQEKLNNYKKLSFRGANNKDCDFINFRSLREIFRTIYYGEILIPGAEREKNNFDDMIRILKAYKPRKDSKYYKLKQDLLINAQNFYDGREMIIKAFKNKIFPVSNPDCYPEYASEEDISPKSSISSDSEDESLSNNTYNDLYENIFNVEQKLNHELIRKYFKKGSLLELFKYLKLSNNKVINSSKEAVIEANLLKLKYDIRNMSDEDVKRKNLDLIAHLVKKIPDTVKKINNREQQPDITDMTELESEESAAQRQKGQGLKILTPKQMIIRLSILLAQKKQ